MKSSFQELLYKGRTTPDIPIPLFEDYKKSEEEKYPNTISRLWLPLKSIKNEAKFNPKYVENISELMITMAAWKKSRGDGNCYYRAVISALMIKSFVPYNSEHKFLNSFWSRLAQISSINEYCQYTKEIKIIIEFLESTSQKFASFNGRIQNFISIHEKLQEVQFDQCLIRVSRIFAHIAFQQKLSEPGFIEFLEAGEMQKTMIRIMTMGQEAEGIDLMVLPLGLDVVVWQYNMFDKLILNKFPDENADETKMKVFVICKLKGHYDCLYSKKELEEDVYNLKERKFYIKPNR
jgi:hypothetical protein